MEGKSLQVRTLQAVLMQALNYAPPMCPVTMVCPMVYGNSHRYKVRAAKYAMSEVAGQNHMVR